MSISFGGMASGLDTNSIVSQLMALERGPQTRLKLQERAVQARQDLLRDIGSRLRTLASAAADLRSAGTWGDTQTVSSSDATRVDAKRVSGAAAGGYQVAVTQLARAEQRSYAYTASTAATQIDVNGVLIDIAAGATLQQVVDTVNGRSDSPVYAAAVNGELVLSGRKTGAANGFTATAGTLVQDTTKAKLALDANYSVDGTAKTSATNLVSDGIVGLELTLKSVTTSAVTINVGAPGPDTERIKRELQEFLDAYNSTVDFVRSKLREKPVANATSDAQAAKGAVYGDSLLNGLLSQLRVSFSAAVGGNPSDLDELSEIGISTGATTGGGTVSSEALAGRLVLDATKLSDALARDPVSLRRLLAGDATTQGFAAAFKGLIDPVAMSGGLIDGRVDGAGSELRRIRSSMTSMDIRLDLREKALRAQFTAMEKALAQSQSQGAWLSGQLSALSG